jgi:CubicO group peptidase (beta-lactamase class C family)
MTQPADLTLANWQLGPHNRRTFGRVREIVPTARVRAAAHPLPLVENAGRLAETVRVLDGDRDLGSVTELLEETCTDGFMVLRDGHVLMERYPGDLAADRNHALFSMSKSLVGAVCAHLADQGALAVDDLVTAHVPELGRSGYAGATIRHLLDMRSGIRFSEDYDDLQAEVRRIDQAVGWLPRTDPDAPERLYDYLPRLVAARPHGGSFEYRSCETDVLGWVCERAAGERMPDLLSRVLWSRIAEHDLDAGVDIDGSVFCDGGLAASLRDMARFGELLCRAGSTGTEQVIPAWWLADALAGGADSRDAYAASPAAADRPGWMYRNQFWVPYADRRVLVCLGIHDQLVYADLDQHTVVVKLSSQPTPLDSGLHAKSFALAEAVVRAAQDVPLETEGPT